MTNRIKKCLAVFCLIIALAIASGLPGNPAPSWVAGNGVQQCDEDCPNVGALLMPMS